MKNRRRFDRIGKKVSVVIGAVLISACAIQRTTRVPFSILPSQAQEASLEQLLLRLRDRSDAFQTLLATAELLPAAGSIYSGVVREYRDVKAHILLDRRSRFRMVGQAPIIRNNIFDIASDGDNFRLSIPSKRKFIVGKNSVTKNAGNTLENLRPQHIFDALVFKSFDDDNEKFFLQEGREGNRQYYIVHAVSEDKTSRIDLKRKVWFDRADLEVFRIQWFGPEGRYMQDVNYGDYQDFKGINYPTMIQLTRPGEDYRLGIRISKVTFNQSIEAGKFFLDQPKGFERVELGNVGASGGSSD